MFILQFVQITEVIGEDVKERLWKKKKKAQEKECQLRLPT